MIRLLTVSAMLLALAVFGCTQSEESESTQEAAEMAADEKAAETGAEEGADMEKQAEQAAEETREMVSEAEKAAEETVDTAAETATDVAEATEEAAGEAVEEVKEAVSPETIELEASFGNITFPHGMHSQAYDCSTCHGEGTPGLFGLDKDKAHPLCRGCHEEEGAGPTGCTDCHQK